MASDLRPKPQSVEWYREWLDGIGQEPQEVPASELRALIERTLAVLELEAWLDAHREDDMGGLALREADYAWITERIMEVADRHAQGRIVSVLEGGYALSALSRSAHAHINALAGL